SVTLSGSTRVGVMFNRESIRINGDNIGGYMGREVIPDPITGANVLLRMFDTDTTNGPTQNAFADDHSSVHLSPLFEQGLNVSVPIFSRIPVLQDAWQLDDAKLNLGWTFLWVGDVADPNQSVVWQASPQSNVFPKVKPDRFSFIQNSLSVGIDWAY
ncbi:MAG: hypothetical protein KDA85_07370, partial [Planctomycetaceae bacterium]|nr:hypothetical protein [Planctomycetaceae bacterium]